MNSRSITTLWALVILATSVLFAPAVHGDQQFVGIITGDVKSTAHQLGMDLKALAKRYGLHVAVFNSAGSVENIYAVYQRPGNHIGLVQSDVLAFVAKVDSDPLLKLMADKIKWVYPLHMQPVHVLAHKAIQRFDDLEGQRVAIGDVHSGTYLTSRLLFELSGVAPREIIAIGDRQALDSLKAGTIDAMITIDGFPVERLALEVAAADGLHLVPVDHANIRSFYPVSTIPTGIYSWQAADVDTVGVKSILVAYDFRNRHCQTIGRVARLIKDHLAWLQLNGHPAWKTVDLSATVKGWKQYKCVNQYLPPIVADEATAIADREPNPVADAIQAVFRP